MITGAFEADQAIVNISGIHKDVRLTREREPHTFGMCIYNDRIVTIQIMPQIIFFSSETKIKPTYYSQVMLEVAVKITKRNIDKQNKLKIISLIIQRLITVKFDEKIRTTRFALIDSASN